MKTLTEFDGFRLKSALAKKAELVQAGKTPEELPAAFAEAMKLEGEKLELMLAALEVFEARPDNLKRVVVFTVAEGKSAPSGSVQKGEKWFLSEFFYIPQNAPRERGERGGRDGGKRGGGRGGKKGGRGGRDGGRGEKRGEGGGGGGAGGRPPREAREGGGGRGPRPAQNPTGAPPKLPVPNKVAATAAAATSAAEKPSSESDSGAGSEKS